MGGFDQAVRAIPPKPECPRCGDARQVELIGREWFCATCSKSWAAK